MFRAILLVYFSFLSVHAVAFETSLGPFESRKRFRSPSDSLRLHSAPSIHSWVIKNLKVISGAEIAYDQKRFRTLATGLFVAENSGSIRGTYYGVISYLSVEDYNRFRGARKDFEYAQKDTIEYLQYRAEGTGFIRLDNHVISVDLTSQNAANLLQVRDPVVEFWIRVIDKDSKPIGWYLTHDEFVTKVHQRSYTNGLRR